MTAIAINAADWGDNCNTGVEMDRSAAKISHAAPLGLCGKRHLLHKYIILVWTSGFRKLKCFGSWETPMAKIPVAILLPAVCVAHAMLLIIR